MTKLTAMGCEPCNPESAQVLWQDGFCRVVMVDQPDYPGYCRVIMERHMSEMTDLSAPERACLMNAAFAAEEVLRDALAPDKINLASLGNTVPHIHWQVIPRYRDDPQFRNPVWAQRNDEARVVNGAERRASVSGAPGRGVPDFDRLARAPKRRLG